MNHMLALWFQPLLLAINTYDSQYDLYATSSYAFSIWLIGSVVGLFSNLFLRFNPAAMLRNATYVAIAFLLGCFLCLYSLYGLLNRISLSQSFLAVLQVLLLVLVTEYYTSGKPVRILLIAAESGAATNIIYGLSVGMESTVLPVIILALIVLAAFTMVADYLVLPLLQFRCLPPLVLR